MGLVGPSAVTTLDEQVKRSSARYQRQADDLRKNVFLTRRVQAMLAPSHMRIVAV
ncbi:MAG: hypothetical protein JOZ71_03360 [Ktedonobacteraceae bacterium]|nr:hypothetical protein [Ktedonobacteraceae bacterium]